MKPHLADNERSGKPPLGHHASCTSTDLDASDALLTTSKRPTRQLASLERSSFACLSASGTCRHAKQTLLIKLLCGVKQILGGLILRARNKLVLIGYQT